MRGPAQYNSNAVALGWGANVGNIGNHHRDSGTQERFYESQSRICNRAHIMGDGRYNHDDRDGYAGEFYVSRQAQQVTEAFKNGKIFPYRFSFASLRSAIASITSSQSLISSKSVSGQKKTSPGKHPLLVSNLIKTVPR